ncbi:hypothetical protein GN156_14880 [bacterium LRH843]|nr:hypothetical protein [bacterium LRH843]
MNQLKKIIEHLHEDEAKTLLFQILFRINLLEETEYSERQLTKDLQRTYKDLLAYSSK